MGLIYYLFHSQISNIGTIWQAMASADPRLLILAFTLHIVGYLLCSWRWQLLIKAQGASVGLVPLAASYMVGIFFNNFLPGVMGGDIVRASDTARPLRSFTKSALTLFVERLTGMAALLILAFFALCLIGWDALGNDNIVWILGAVAGLIALIALILFNPRLQKAIRYLLSFPFMSRILRIAQGIHHAAEAFRGNKQVIAWCVLISVLFQINVIFHYFLIGHALEIPVAWYYYFIIIPISLLILMIPASINGIGLREQVFVYFFAQFGVSAAYSISLAWIAFGMVLLQAILGGIVFAMRRERA